MSNWSKDEKTLTRLALILIVCVLGVCFLIGQVP